MKNSLPAIAVALAIIISIFFAANAYKYKFRSVENIAVTGSAEKDFVSDQIVWTASYTRKSMDIKNAYPLLKDDEIRVRTYLKGKGIPDTGMVFSSISIDKEYNERFDQNGKLTGREFAGYNLRQSVTIDSRDIERVEKISREITELIQAGLELNSSPPSYYYSKLSELKIDLLAKASADAKLRAETIAKNAGGSLGKIRKATMGVFQITGQNSDENFSYGGAFNTSNKNKTASITLKVDFEVD
jgi:hypothetical protein